MNHHPASHYHCSKSIHTQPLDDQLVVLDLAGDVYYSLNGTARWYWESLMSGKNPEEIAQNAVDRYMNLSLEQAQKDIDALIQKLLDLGILEVSDT